MKPVLVGDKYQLDRRLGRGAYGEVYLGHDLDSGEEVALKLEYHEVDPSQLQNEVEIYKKLDQGRGIPRFYWLGYDCEFTIMAFELLGPSLEDLFNYCSRKFSLKTVLLLADQLISRFQYIHSKGFIHRDVKPNNLLMGIGTQGNTVYTTDIGLAKEIEDPHRYRYTYPMVGTPRYASINALLGKEQSPRDDMESLGYVLLYFLKGSLPWQGLKCKPEEKEKMILKMKQQATGSGLFHNVPVEFKKYFELISSDKSLSYRKLRRLFSDLFHRQNFHYDNVFDWTELLYLEKLAAVKGPQEDRRPQKPTGNQEFNAAASMDPDSPQDKTRLGFWDNLSRVPLCRRALREFNKRAVPPTALRAIAKRELGDCEVKELQRFAQHGGPDLRSILGSSLCSVNPDTGSTTYSSKDAVFEQQLIDNGISLFSRDANPTNWEEMQERLARRRPSLSSSQLSKAAFEDFQHNNDKAINETEVMCLVFPIIIGKTNIPSGYSHLFDNLEPLTDHMANPQPNYFNVSHTVEIQRKVRDHLGHYIIPSSYHHRGVLPNFFLQVKGSEGRASHLKRQIAHDLAVGARGMLKLQSYGLDVPVFDNKAYTFGATYYYGHLQLYVMHPTEPRDPNGKPEYHMTQIRAFALDGSLDSLREGITAFRNMRDLAKEKRDDFIASANEMANAQDKPKVASVDAHLNSITATRQSHGQHESKSTSTDELAIPERPSKRAKTCGLVGNENRRRTGNGVHGDERDE
ncbi:kinase-like protein [Pyrenochaeta sp. DS3sAY3a]|nr:kinase-like protein [Pyrenochaeta sp. DS3sAY3a]